MAMGVFEVHAGSFEIGKAHQMLRGHLIMKASGHFFREKIPLSEIVELEVASQESVSKLGGAIGWGIAGDVLLGPVGLLAGLLRGGKGNRVTFVCKLKDGRKFLATAPSSVFSQMQIALSTSEFGRPPKAVAHQDVTHSETTAATNFDRQKWNALLLYDKDIAAAAERIRSLGPRWVDELASAYLALNDKQYLPNIVEGIVERARLEPKKKMTVTINGEAENSTEGNGQGRKTDMKLCPNCGRWNYQTATRCSYCGASPSSKSAMGRVLIGAYVILFGLGGIAGILEGNVLTGLLFLASAIIVLPLSTHLAERWFNIAVPGWLRAVGGGALFFAAAATIQPQKAAAPTVPSAASVDTKSDTRPTAPTQAAFAVTVMDTKYGLVVAGKTNLPRGLEMLVEIERKGVEEGGENAIVGENGAFYAGPFSGGKAKLAGGRYTVEINSGIVDIQPDDMKAAAGPNWSNFSGPLVHEMPGGIPGEKVVMVTVPFSYVPTDRASEVVKSVQPTDSSISYPDLDWVRNGIANRVSARERAGLR